MFYSPFLQSPMNGMPVAAGNAMAAPLAGGAAPQFGAAAAQINHPMMAYQPMMMGAQTPQQRTTTSPFGGLLNNPQQLAAMKGLLGGGSPTANVAPSVGPNSVNDLGAQSSQQLLQNFQQGMPWYQRLFGG